MFHEAKRIQMKIVRVLDGKEAWNRYVNASPRATAYHQYSWQEVIERSFGHQGYYLAVLDENGVWQGILPLIHIKSRLFGNFLISLPFVNYGGLLTESPAATDYLLREAEDLRHEINAEFVELRHHGEAIEGLATRQHKVTMILPLEADSDSQWGGFNPKLRNQIRKAEKSGLTAVVGHLEMLDGFYEVFARNMRDLGTPVYSKAFFRNLLTAFPDTARIISVLHQGKTVAAGLVCWFRDTIEMPWASSSKDFKALCPNNLLYWEAIRFAIEGGFTRFDFGRSTPFEGTYNFKKQWGAEPVPLFWQYLLEPGEVLPELSPKNPKYELAIKLWKKLPLFLTNQIGPHIVRNIP